MSSEKHMERAELVANQIAKPGTFPHADATYLIAAALAKVEAETREACAEIAECVVDEKDVMAISACTEAQTIAYRGGERAAKQIARAILAEGEKPQDGGSDES